MLDSKLLRANIDFVVEQEYNVYPMIPAGMSINELIEEPVNKETL